MYLVVVVVKEFNLLWLFYIINLNKKFLLAIVCVCSCFLSLYLCLIIICKFEHFCNNNIKKFKTLADQVTKNSLADRAYVFNVANSCEPYNHVLCKLPKLCKDCN